MCEPEAIISRFPLPMYCFACVRDALLGYCSASEFSMHAHASNGICLKPLDNILGSHFPAGQMSLNLNLPI